MDMEEEEITTTDDSEQTASSSKMGYRAFVAYIEECWETYQEKSDLRYSNLREVFDDHIIVATGFGNNAAMWKIPYHFEESEIEFEIDSKQAVELKVEWTEKSLAIKAIGKNTIGGYGILWGDEQHVDLHGEWFSNKTEELTKVFDSVGTIPVLFHHGMDDTLKTSVIGKMKTMSTDDIGLWWEAIVTEHEAYKQYIKPLLDRGLLYSSSGTFPGAKRVDRKSNFIERWPVAEMTMTHTPAEYRFMELPLAEIKSYYKSIGINSDDIFADENSTTEPVTETDAEEAAETAKKQEIELAQMWLDLQNLETNL